MYIHRRNREAYQVGAVVPRFPEGEAQALQILKMIFPRPGVEAETAVLRRIIRMDLHRRIDTLILSVAAELPRHISGDPGYIDGLQGVVDPEALFPLRLRDLEIARIVHDGLVRHGGEIGQRGVRHREPHPVESRRKLRKLLRPEMLPVIVEAVGRVQILRLARRENEGPAVPVDVLTVGIFEFSAALTDLYRRRRKVKVLRKLEAERHLPVQRKLLPIRL